MSSRPLTLLLLREGRDAIHLELPGSWRLLLFGSLLVPLMMGATARRCLELPSRAGGLSLHAREVAGSLRTLALDTDSGEAPPPPERLHVRVPRALAEEKTFAAAAPPSPPELSRAPRAAPAVLASATRAVLSAREIARAFPSRHGITAVDPQAADELARGWLRLSALHLGESIRVRPFGDDGRPQPAAFDALRHLMRCRVTGEEVAIDPRLVRLLVQLSTHYNRPIQLVSGHRTPFVIGTHPTSQHAFGRAADIRIAGVPIESLRSTAIELGARGVGLYPEKGFVHIDVRNKPKYFWTYTEAEGEQADMRPPSTAFASGARASLR